MAMCSCPSAGVDGDHQIASAVNAEVRVWETGKAFCFLLEDYPLSILSQLIALSVCLLFLLLVCAAAFEQPWSCAHTPHPGDFHR